MCGEVCLCYVCVPVSVGPSFLIFKKYTEKYPENDYYGLINSMAKSLNVSPGKTMEELDEDDLRIREIMEEAKKQAEEQAEEAKKQVEEQAEEAKKQAG